MGYKEMISWEIRDAISLSDYYIHFEECSHNPQSLTDCTFVETAVCSKNGTQVFLHCKGTSLHHFFEYKSRAVTATKILTV